LQDREDKKMPVDVIMPKLGLTITEGAMVVGKKKKAERPERERSSSLWRRERSHMDVEAPEDGVQRKILVQEPESVPVGTIVAYLLKAGEIASDIAGAAVHDSAYQISMEATDTPKTPSISPQSDSSEQQVRAAHLAKKYARQNNVDISPAVKGPGSGGRIVKKT
jgi:pyruvate dehydrogenase E2 component (dihydrolipoamide acetyltransferase)